MEMFYLIVLLGNAPAIIPEKYTKEQCETAGAIASRHDCIPAPSAEYCKFKFISRMVSNGSSGYAVTEKVCE